MKNKLDILEEHLQTWTKRHPCCWWLLRKFADFWVFVLKVHIKECSELIKMLMKKHRKKGNDAEIIDEACDVLTTILVMLHQYGVDEQTIRQNIIAKCSRALERYENSGEL